MATVVGKNSRGGLKKVASNTKSSSGSSKSSSTQIGLNQSQVNQLKNSSWADKSALASYEKSGSVVGGRNNPNGKGRENVAAIPADAMNPVTPVNPPSYPTPTDPGSVVTAGNIGLQSTSDGMYTVDPATGLMTTSPATDKFAQNQQARLDEMMKAFTGMNSGEADLAQIEKDNRYKQKQQAVSQYQGQLNSIVASSQAEQLKLEGQGRGQTTGFIGGEQARINREAAIAALPVQAQLAAAQGDLAMAEERINKLFQIKRQDAQALFNFKAQVINSVYDFADKQEQRRLDEVNKIETRKYQEQQDFLKTQRSLLSSALQQGAPSSVVNAINGATTQEEALIAAGEYTGDILARQIQQANLASIYDQMNSRRLALREDANKAATVKEAESVKRVADAEQALELKALAESLKEMKGLSSAVGFGFKKSLVGSIPFVSGDALAGTKRADFEATAERVANLLTLDNLDLMSGVLSETDIKILETAGSNLRNFNQSEEQYKKEVDRIISTMDRTIKNNGITAEQAVFYGLIDDQDLPTLDAIWSNL